VNQFERPRDERDERMLSEHPHEYLRRREFLARTALAAGVAASAALTLTPNQLVAEAARRERRTALPSPRNMPVDTFVVLMMENRSFDHYLGWLPYADGRQAGVRYRDDDGRLVATRPLAPDWQGCGHPDPDHSWEGGRVQVNGGRMDGFLRSGENDVFAISYYREGDLGFIHDAAKTFTVCDRFFCSLLGPTFPNREYMHAAQSYGLKDNSLPPQAGYPTGFPWETTIWHQLERAGVSHRYFYCDVPVTALWGARGLAISAPVSEYYARCATGTLPHVSFVDPNFGGAGAGAGLGVSGDEHPHGDVRTGQAFMADVVHAFMSSPQWRRGALFIVYDEWGGFFDHVPPPRVPDARASRDPMADFGQMGIRIPAVIVSPWVRRRHVSHTVFGFESILRMIRYRFRLPALTGRDARANNIATAFDWQRKPRVDVPPLPDPPHVVSRPCAVSTALAPGAEQRHPVMELVRSGWLERVGFDYRPAAFEEMFREPKKLADRLRTSTSRRSQAPLPDAVGRLLAGGKR